MDSGFSGYLLETGARYTFGKYRLRPYFGMRAVRYWQGAYAENGDYGVAVYGYKGNHISSELGLTYQFAGAKVSCQAGLSWRHLWSAGNTAVDFNYRNDPATSFSSTADNIRDSIELSMTGNMTLGQGFRLVPYEELRQYNIEKRLCI